MFEYLCFHKRNFSLILFFILFHSNHCWVSFTGFAEAYNDVFEADIRVYGSIISTTTDEAEGKKTF